MKTTTRKNIQHPLEIKLEVIKLYNEGIMMSNIAKKLNLHLSVVQNWIKRYKVYGTAGLIRTQFQHVSFEQKIAILDDMRTNSLTYLAASIKYNISETTLHTWQQKVLEGGNAALIDVSRHAKLLAKIEAPSETLSHYEIKKLQQEVLRLKMEKAKLMHNS